MNQSSCHCSWLALGAQCTGCFRSFFPHMWHVFAFSEFSVSPISAGLCSCQQEASEVHLHQVGMKSASNQRRFRFRAHLFDHMNSLLGFQDRENKHMLMQITGPPWKANLPLEALCFFWWGYCMLLCQFWNGECWCTCTPPSWDTKLWRTQNQAEISRLKIKFGDVPGWVRSCLKQKPTQSWKCPLLSWEPSDLVNLVSQAN